MGKIKIEQHPHSMKSAAKAHEHNAQGYEKSSRREAPDYEPGTPEYYQRYLGNSRVQSALGSAPSDVPLTAKSSIEPETPVSSVPPIVHKVLSTPGQPLDAETQNYMGSRFDHDFSHVRIHTDAQSGESARAINAQAYTLGQNVVFGTGKYVPDSSEGRGLLAHEFAHVVQQRDSETKGILTLETEDSAREYEASAAASQILRGQPVSNLSQPAEVGIQRATSTFDPSKMAEHAATSAITIVISKFLNASFWFLPSEFRQEAAIGFEEEMRTQLVDQNKLRDALKQMNEFKENPFAWLKFTKGLMIGYAEGIISPVTGLFDMAVFAETLQSLAKRLVQKNLLSLAMDAVILAQKCINFSDNLKSEFVAWVMKDWMRAANLFSHPDLAAARQAGRITASILIGTIEAPWKPEEPHKPWEFNQIINRPLGYVDSLVERADKWLLDAPWSKIGSKIGYAAGFTLISAVLLVVSDGIGNIIAGAGKALGEVSRSLRFAGDILVGIGRAITAVEAGFALIMQAAIKALGLEPLINPILRLFSEIDVFLKNLFGVTKQGESAAVGLVGKGMSELESVANLRPKVTPHAPPLPETPPHLKVPGSTKPVHTGTEPPSAPAAPVMESKVAPRESDLVPSPAQPERVEAPPVQADPSASKPLSSGEPPSPITETQKPVEPAQSAVRPEETLPTKTQKPIEPEQPAVKPEELQSNAEVQKTADTSPKEGLSNKLSPEELKEFKVLEEVDGLKNLIQKNQKLIDELQPRIDGLYKKARSKRAEASNLQHNKPRGKKVSEIEAEIAKLQNEAAELEQRLRPLEDESRKLALENNTNERQIHFLIDRPAYEMGGSHKYVRAKTVGGHVNHMPSSSGTIKASGNRKPTYDEGPGIWMTVDDHKLCRSTGSSTEALTYHARQAKLIGEGKFLEAQQLDILDIQSKFGTKYDKSIEQMVKYTKRLISEGKIWQIP